MQTRPLVGVHDTTGPPQGPTLRPGRTSPDQVRIWRRDRIGHCIATLLRDPVVAGTVARAIAAADDCRARPDDVTAAAGCRAHWVGRSTLRGIWH